MSDDDLRQPDTSWVTTTGQSVDWPTLVFPSPFPVGLHAPGQPSGDPPRPHTYDWRAMPRTNANTRGVRPDGTLRDLNAALLARYGTDAHAVGYVVRGPDGRLLDEAPRVNISGIPWLRAQGYDPLTVTWWADVDNPKDTDPATGATVRRAWNEELLAESEGWMREVPLLRYATRYFTLGGQRFVWRLGLPVPMERAGVLIAALARELYAAGVRLDGACFDVTRLMRLPRVVRRDTKLYYHGAVSHEDAPPLPAEQVRAYYDAGRAFEAAAAARGVRARKPKPPVASGAAPPATIPRGQTENGEVLAVPPSLRRDPTAVDRAAYEPRPPVAWQWFIDEVGAAIRRQVGGKGHYHRLSLLLSGALAWRGFRASTIPAITAAMVCAGGATDYAKHHGNGVDTLVRAAGGMIRIAGTARLVQEYPEVGRAFRIALGRMRAAREQSGLPTADEAYALVAANLADPDALGRGVLVRPGVGKTRAACAQAVEAARLYAIYGKREYRTAISVPTHELAKQVVADITQMAAERGFDIPIQRLYSPASVLDANGELVCRYPNFVRMLAASGASVQREACEGRGKKRCSFYDTCAARAGMDGDDEPVVLVTTHAKIRQARAHAGDRGLLIVDEPGSITQDKTLDEKDLSDAIACDTIESRYLLALPPLARALRIWLQTYPDERRRRDGPPPPPVSLADAADAGAGHPLDTRATLEQRAAQLGVAYDETTTDGELLVRNAAAAFDEQIETNSRSCPVLMMPMDAARRSVERSAALRPVIATYNALYDAARAAVEAARDGTPPPAVWAVISPRAKDRSVLIKTVDRHYRDVLLDAPNRRVVFADANLDAHVPVIERVMGAKLPLVEVGARDQAEVQRTVWIEPASRRRLLDENKLPNWAELVPLFERIGAWLVSRPEARRAGIVTFKSIALPLAALLGVATEKQQAELAKMPEWRKFTDDSIVCAKALRRGTPWYGPWIGEVRIGYYGAMRGLNAWRDLDALVTLGDPRPNIDAVYRESQYLNDDDVAVDLAIESRQLQLVQDELQQVHERLRVVRRGDRCKELHVGVYTPGGVAWETDVTYVLPEDSTDISHSVVEYLQSALGRAGGQASLSRSIGVSQSTISRIVNGSIIPSEEIIKKIKSFVDG